MVADPYIISSPSLPDIHGYNVILSNAFIGHRLHGDSIFMNGLYNGYKTACHRARIPCPIPYVNEAVTSYVLDCRNAIYTVNGSHYSQKFYAHSVLNRVFVTEIAVNSGSVKLAGHQGQPSIDLDVTESYKTQLYDGFQKSLGEVNVFHGQIKETETKHSPKLEVFVISTNLPSELNDGIHISISSFGFTYDESVDFYNKAVCYYNVSKLFYSHQNSWKYIWNTANIDAVDDNEFSKKIKSALFYLLSSFPAFSLDIPGNESYPFQFYGVSPGSLGNGGNDQDYWGHVFWDQDLWMLPGVMVLFPEFVKQSIKYRILMLDGAKTKANENGYLGAMYPWESGRTGVDVCPGAIYAKYQQHITACVVYAIRQYIYLTGSWDILDKEGAWDVVKETANFWVSRVEWDGQNFVINHVMDPDEYHYDVNNSCFTNAAARLNLLFAIEAAEKLGKTPDPRWVSVSKESDGIKIPFDEKFRYHPEFDGYEQGTLIKQASVVLIGYPLGCKMDDDVRKNDIIVYENCTDKGPGMTYSMYSIGMLELGDVVTAKRLYQIQFKNIREPFMIWNEYPNGVGCTNFLTAIGGFLQSLLYGYLGLRVYEDTFQIEPNLIPGVHKAIYTGIYYHKERFNFEIDSNNLTVTHTTGNSFEHWVIENAKKTMKWPLITNEPIKLPLGKYFISLCDGYEII